MKPLSSPRPAYNCRYVYIVVNHRAIPRLTTISKHFATGTDYNSHFSQQRLQFPLLTTEITLLTEKITLLTIDLNWSQTTLILYLVQTFNQLETICGHDLILIMRDEGVKQNKQCQCLVSVCIPTL